MNIVAEFDCVNKNQELIVKVGVEWLNLLLAKNRNYGSSVFKRPSLAPHIPAPTAIYVRMSDKIERLQQLAKGEQDLVNESIPDTIRDLGAYCLLWLVMNSEHSNLECE